MILFYQLINYIDWRDNWGWNQPLGYNNGWNGAWNGAYNPGWGWNGAYEGWRAPVVSEPVVARRLGARYDTSSLLGAEHHHLGDYSVSYIQKKGGRQDDDFGGPEGPGGPGGQDGMPSPKEVFDQISGGKSFITPQELSDALAQMGEKVSVSEIKKKV